MKVNKNFVNGSNGLAPIFSDMEFYGTRVDRAFFPFSTAFFSEQETDTESDFYINPQEGAFLKDIKIANDKIVNLASKEKLLLVENLKKKWVS